MGTSFKNSWIGFTTFESVEIFCNFIEQKYERLDILINNAAQTVRRPAGFYTHLMANEERR
jgi:NAD(P)-dependent dehydrogenase (short-subunit alcohol dehydrogenase family)